MYSGDPVNRFMTEPVHSIGPDATIAAAKQLFMMCSFHHLPVVENAHVVGMLSSVDITRACVSMQSDPGPPALAPGRRSVREVMSSMVIEIGEHESVRRAIELMVRHAIHSLPVVNTDRELIGIITTTDIMHGCLEAQPNVAAQNDITGSYPLAEDRLTTALASARRAVARHRDPGGIAATLLATQQRVASLQEIAVVAKRYLNAGQDEHLHSLLTRALDRAQRLDERIRGPAQLLLP
jgi:CBS domain-containing protein